MKLVIKLALILLLGFVGLAVAGYFLMPPAAKKAIEVGSHKALGTPTTLQSIQAGFGLGSTSMGIAGFTAEQPKGFEGSPFLKIGSIGVSVDTFSVLKDTIRVPEVKLDGLELRLVQNGKESNFLEVYDSIRKVDGESDPSTPPPASEGSGKSIDIGLVKVSGVKASFDLTGIPGINQSYTFSLPNFEIDMSRKANEARLQNVEQATARLMETLIEQTIARAKQELSPELAALIGGDVAGLKDRVNAELNKLRGAADAKVDQAKEELRSKLGEEFGKQLDGALGKENADKVQETIEKGADAILDGAAEKVLPKDAEKDLKEKADETLKQGTKDLKKKVGGLLGGKKDE